MGKSKAPTAPDFNKYAMAGQNGPMGQVSWTTGPDGTPTMNTGFTGPAAQTFGNLQTGMQTASEFDPSKASQQAQDKIYGAYKSRLDPMWEQRQKGFDASMANQGIDFGMPAYGDASRTFNQGMNDAYGQAIKASVEGGWNEQAQARQNAMLPFGQAGAMMAWLPKGDPYAPFKGAEAQYQGELDKYSADQAKKGSALEGVGNIAGMAFGGGFGGGKKG